MPGPLTPRHKGYLIYLFIDPPCIPPPPAPPPVPPVPPSGASPPAPRQGGGVPPLNTPSPPRKIRSADCPVFFGVRFRAGHLRRARFASRHHGLPPPDQVSVRPSDRQPRRTHGLRIGLTVRHHDARDRKGSRYASPGPQTPPLNTHTTLARPRPGKYQHPTPSVHGIWPETGAYGTSKCIAPSVSSPRLL